MEMCRTVTVAMLVIVSFAAAAAAAQPEGIGERLGEKFDQALGQVRQEARDAAVRLREGFDEVRASVDRMSVAGRVYARLHWDQALVDSSISVEVQDGGTATISGTVASQSARTTAEQLAASTVGVSRVVNRLEVVEVRQPSPGGPSGSAVP